MKIAILNQKGGVGKSTITVNLGYRLATMGKRTLIIDLDPQAHSSVIYSPELPKNQTISELIISKNLDINGFVRPAETVIEKNGEEERKSIENLFIIPANIHLATSSEMVISRVHREKILHNYLKKLQKPLDYILLDCPPTLGVLTVNAIFTADMILIPTNYSKYSLDGISDLFNSITEVKETGDYQYRLLRNCKEGRNKRTNEVIEGQLARYEGNLLKTIIMKNEAINQALMMDLPVFLYEPKSQGAQDFKALSEEVLSFG